MKNLNRLLLAVTLVFALSKVNAQDKDHPWQISVGVNAVDPYPSGDGLVKNSTVKNAQMGEKKFDEYFNVEDHWNILPSLSQISVSKYLGGGFSFGVLGSLNKLTRWGDVPGTYNPEEAKKVDDLSYYGADGLIKYSIGEALSWNTFDPFVGVGGGYTWVDEIGAGTVNGTLGFNVWFTQNIGLTLQSTYKHAFEDYLQTHFQHSAGITIKFGGKDTDGDGINDSKDACPDVPGLKEFNGCPDTDGDGIEDSKDGCPNEAGTVENNGCPDTDGDGIVDKDDKCPTVPGLAALNGCPDTDGDGVADNDDKCPTVPGPASNNGCPEDETTKNNLTDGTGNNNNTTVIKTENKIFKTVHFDTNRSNIKAEAATILKEIADYAKANPDATFTIEGHTDSRGSDALNQRLSEARANSVKKYLTGKGVKSSKLTTQGYGKNNPIDTNDTEEGRANNRRAEVKSNN